MGGGGEGLVLFGGYCENMEGLGCLVLVQLCCLDCELLTPVPWLCICTAPSIIGCQPTRSTVVQINNTAHERIAPIETSLRTLS